VGLPAMPVSRGQNKKMGTRMTNSVTASPNSQVVGLNFIADLGVIYSRLMIFMYSYD
jgi:hypothetical protein